MKRIITVTAIIALSGAGLYYVSNPEPLDYAPEYHIVDAECSFLENEASEISLTFIPSEEAVHQIPKYQIKEIPEQAQTKIIFQDIGREDFSFVYGNVISNPLIEAIDYQKKEGSLILSVYREGPLTSTEIIEDSSSLILRFPRGNQNYPIFSEYQPEKNSIVYPSTQEVRIRVFLQSPLKEAFVFLQGKAIDFDIIENQENQYLFQFSEVLDEESHYQAKVVARDQEDRISSTFWQFEAQMPMARADLSADRFKYLGWWGQVNTNKINIREKPTTHSEVLGTFSTANRVKVLNEVNGESIDSNNLWYQIDGGRHPDAYIFSRYITPIVQPEPPKEFNVPEEVSLGERWIDVNLTDNVLTIFDYDQPLFVTYISTGRQKNPTITGIYYVWFKAKKDRMTDGPPAIDYRYDLLNVPHVLYYYGGYAVHGTYWHDKFGTYQSAGCTNLTQGDAKFVFDNTRPQLSSQEEKIKIDKSYHSTLIYNHY